jgi:hypothetical protein
MTLVVAASVPCAGQLPLPSGVSLAGGPATLTTSMWREFDGAETGQWELGPLKFRTQKPDCDPLALAWDKPLPGREYHAPRVVWWGGYALASMAAADGLDWVYTKATHRKLPPWIGATTASAGIGLLPHVIGYAKHEYRINVGDWSFDLLTRSLPAFWRLGGTLGMEDRLQSRRLGIGRTGARLIALGAYAGGAYLLHCRASP